MNQNKLFHHVVATIFLVFFLILNACGGKNENELRYVAIGASDATGIGATPLTNGYVYRIQDGIEASTDKDVSLVNLGIPGATSDIIEDVELPAAKNANPDIVTIFMGGNDINDGISPVTFGNRVRSVVQGVVNDTNAIVAIANLPDMSKLPRFVETPDPDVTPDVVNAYNQQIAAVALDFGVPLVDLSKEPVEDYLVSSDGFHPNSKGYEKIAEKFLAVLIPLISSKIESEEQQASK